ncbi:hypothetical protein TL16_g11641 [Triparma laevis f. inornata]|uniref:Uncharacterized protein n=2 Tax=Triparma laevis TaxID=1534972 RepID=A0A9W7L1K8_9STRA|nr:hypothetical protein TL16_g11641 [Triparma laevis f. inornata]GMI18816.1 hypothetical protein TrLO_g11891 [Triparma laevis f. longispina]
MFVEKALSNGASLKSTDSNTPPPPASAASALTLLGYLIGFIGALVSLGFSTALGAWPLSIALAWIFSYLCFRLSLKAKLTSPETWKWSTLQSLSSLFFLTGVTVLSSYTLNTLLGLTLIAFLPSLIHSILLYKFFGNSYILFGVNVYLFHYIFMISILSILTGEPVST